MVKFWSRIPFLRTLIPFVSGILYGIYNSGPLNFWAVSAVLFAVISFWFTIARLATGRYAHRWLAGIPFFICFFSFGVLLTWIENKEALTEDHFLSGEEKIYLVRFTGVPESSKNGFRIEAEVKGVIDKGRLLSVSGMTLLFMPDSIKNEPGLSVDRYAFIRTRLSSPRPPSNPGQFDYAAFLRYRGIHYTASVIPSAIKYTDMAGDKRLNRYTTQLRSSMLGRIDKYITSENVKAVGAALLLGYDEWLDPELGNRFSDAGVLHVLCVSGMHTGLIYFLIASVTLFMDRNRLLRHLRFLIILCTIWFYAVLTGLAPSVTRAAAMLTLVILGKWFNRQAGIYNVIFGAAMFMLIIDPFVIMSAGFRLSFLAVCGIVLLQKNILSVFSPPGSLLFRVWELIAVSLAAQLATFPLSVQLFGKFPNYFLLGNILVLPVISAAVYSGLAMLLLGFIEPAGNAAGFIFEKLLSLVIFFVDRINRLPGAVSENIYFSVTDTFLCYFLIILSVTWLSKKYHALYFAVLGVLLIWTGYSAFAVFCQRNATLTVYSTGRTTCLSITKGGEAALFLSGNDRESNTGYHVKTNLKKHGITKADTIYLEKQAYYLPDNEILIYHGTKGRRMLQSPGKIKTLIVGGSLSKDEMNSVITPVPEKVILSTSLTNYDKIKLIELLDQKGISWYDVKTSGYYEKRLSAGKFR